MSKTLGKPQPDGDVVNKEPKVLLIGYGWVGQYMGKYFTEAHYVESDGLFRFQPGNLDLEDEEIINPPKYDLAIIGVPTPMNPETGQCDVSIVEESVKKYKDIVDIFLVKSTVEIGTCKRLEKKYGVSVCMSPEYVGETLGHPLLEARRDAFQIIGGNKIAREAVARMFMKVLHADAPIHLVSHEEAEIIKYSENEYLMRLVDYWQGVWKRCQVFNVSFNAVREGLVMDPRVLRTHSNVYHDNLGWSGKCLPKDMNALAYKLREVGRPNHILEHMIEKNADIRKDYNNSERLLPEESAWYKEHKKELANKKFSIVIKAINND